MLSLEQYPLSRLADQVGTPFYLYDGSEVKTAVGRLQSLVEGLNANCRYALKANSNHRVLQTCRDAGLWIDAVSGNEVLRAMRAGFPGGAEPPVIMLTSDVFRDNALGVVLEHGVMPNVGSPGMIAGLAGAGYRGPIAVRINPGFGHGHVQSCDTGGPSSKHGIWPEDLSALRDAAKHASIPITVLHAHVGTGPAPREFDENMRRLVGFFADVLPAFADVTAVNLGGGIPFPYKPGAEPYDLQNWYRPVLAEAEKSLSKVAGRPIRIEVEPGRYGVAGAGLLVARVTDIKETRANAKGPGHTFVMVDAGFNDLVRPAMYGSYHHISVVGAGVGRKVEPLVIAGPLCESGDVFTRDDQELIQPRMLPRPDVGDLLVLHDAGAYGAAMSSNYVSMGRAPQVWWQDGKATLSVRRETLDDIVATECNELL
ncbi:MAG: diaminopimelate decarboxylase [Deltaproteobacteria bacterium]|nr:diaminopimelate decarboxylase [Deltaproteobacteria bacterium]